MREDVLILDGQDPKLLRKQQIKQQRYHKELNRQARSQAKEEARNKERARNRKPIYIKTVNHKPTYSILSVRRLEGKAERTNNNFKCTPAFTSKSEIQSLKSQSRLKNAINWMLLFADKKRVYSKAGRFIEKTGKWQHNFYFRLAFLTLTLPDRQMHPDDFIKEHMLQPFLYWLNRYYKALYVWKAESQLNGNIHFHLTIDTFVPWKSVRAKWNSLCAKQGYCKVMQDGSNDKGDAATQIKSVLNTLTCAKDIGGYMSKKDLVKDILKKAFGYIIEGNEEIHKETVGAYKWLLKTKHLPEKAQIIFDTVKNAYNNASLHCKWAPPFGTFNDKDNKWDPSVIQNDRDLNWFKRVIDGRLWGCSENLSGVNVFLDETLSEFEKEENIFFRKNTDIYNLGKKVVCREKEKYAKIDKAERAVRGITDTDIENKYRFMNNVYIHKHLSEMKQGATLQKLIHEEKMARQKNFQTFFKEDELINQAKN